jgi:hypothetical protein
MSIRERIAKKATSMDIALSDSKIFNRTFDFLESPYFYIALCALYLIIALWP